MTDVMLDLETWGTEPGCAIRSIGAVAFDPGLSAAPNETFYVNISDASCERVGLIKDAATIAWWEQHLDAALALQFEQVPLYIAAMAFCGWWRSVEGKCVWSHGANFDEPVWRVASKAVGVSVPWNYRDVRDTRTLYALSGFDPKSVPAVGTLHNARDDAVTQALAVQAAFRKVKSVLQAGESA